MSRVPDQRHAPTRASEEFECAECGRQFQTPDPAISDEAKTIFCSVECWTAMKTVIPAPPTAKHA